MSDIAALFARNPLETPYTPEELRAVVERFREGRAKFNLDAATGPKKTASAPKALDPRLAALASQFKL